MMLLRNTSHQSKHIEFVYFLARYESRLPTPEALRVPVPSPSTRYAKKNKAILSRENNTRCLVTKTFIV
jgi:hypothetical protein